jgi:uncharacterized integral membrane protein
MKFLSWLFTVILIFIALSFALSNRQSVTVNLWPLGLALQAPLFLLTLGTLFLGLLLGAMVGWAVHLPQRMQSKRLQNDIANLREKIETLQLTSGPQRRSSDRSLGRTRKWRLWGPR